MSRISVDTSFIIAFMDKKDQHHKRALKIYNNRVRKVNVEIICMDCVVNEVYSVMARKLIERGMSGEFSKVADLIGGFLENIDVVRAYQYLPKLHSKVVDLINELREDLIIMMLL